MDNVGTVILGKAEDRQPVGVPVHHGKVAVVSLEEVHAYVRKGEVRLHRLLRGRCWIRRSHEDAVLAVGSQGDKVLLQGWPKQCLRCSLQHSGDSSVA